MGASEVRQPNLLTSEDVMPEQLEHGDPLWPSMLLTMVRQTHLEPGTNMDATPLPAPPTRPPRREKEGK